MPAGIEARHQSATTAAARQYLLASSMLVKLCIRRPNHRGVSLLLCMARRCPTVPARAMKKPGNIDGFHCLVIGRRKRWRHGDDDAGGICAACAAIMTSGIARLCHRAGLNIHSPARVPPAGSGGIAHRCHLRR